jgi:hypothetical protein
LVAQARSMEPSLRMEIDENNVEKGEIATVTNLSNA